MAEYTLEEIEALGDKTSKQFTAEEIDAMSRGELDGSELGLISKAPLLGSVAAIGKMVSPYTSAPSRSAVMAGVKGENPFDAFMRQFGHSAKLAPTGTEIASQIGVSGKGLSEYAPSLYSETGEGLPLQRGGAFDISPADVAGLGIDVGADWTNLLGAGAIAKGIAKPVAKGVVKGASYVPATVAGGVDLAMMQSPSRVLKGETAARGAVKSLEGKIGEAASSVNRVVNPKQVSDYGRMSDIAKSVGIDSKDIPAAVEFGPSSFISRAERSVMEGPAGETKIEKFYENARKVDDTLKSIVDPSKSAVSLDEAGNKLMTSYNGAVSEIMDNADITYKKVQKYAPGLYVNKDAQVELNSAMAGIDKRAKGLISRGITKTDKEQGAQLLRATEAVRRAKGSFKQTVEALDMIGKTAFKAEKTNFGDIPPLTKELQGLYFDARKAIIDTVERDVSKDFATELVDNNAKISSLLKDRKQISSALELATPPEKRLGMVFSDTNRISAAKRILPKEEFNQLAANYVMNSMPKGPEGIIRTGQLRTWIQKETPKLKLMLEPEQFKRLSDVAEFGNRFGTAVLSTSGTGASNSFRTLVSGIFNGQTTDAVVEMLKARARTGSFKPDETTMQKMMKEVNAVVPGVSSPKRFLGQRENQLSQFLKGSDVLGTQSETQNRRLRRLKALEGK